MKQLAQNILNRLRWLLNAITGKKQGADYYNIYHPDFAELVEPAFKVNGKQYYRFIKDVEIPYGRYMFIQTFLYEQQIRMDLATLNGYIQKMKFAVNGSVQRGIDLITVVKTLGQMESRVELAFDVDTTYRLASVMYFDDTEDLITYDKPHNDKKVLLWKGARVTDFFYTRPMGELLGLSSFSPEGLVTFIEGQEALLKELITETPAP